jgi:hypothetical protein
MAKKALGYGRVSTVKQVADGVSLEAQRIEITSFAIASGYDLLDVLCEDGVSGSKDEVQRPALTELLAAVRAGEVSVVIVCKRDRLASDQALAGHIETVIRRTGAELISIDEEPHHEGSPDDGCRSRKPPRCAAHPLRHACAEAQGKTFGTVPFGYRRNAEGGLDPQPGDQDRRRNRRHASERCDARRNRCTPHCLECPDAARRGKWSPEQVRSISNV